MDLEQPTDAVTNQLGFLKKVQKLTEVTESQTSHGM